MGHNLNMKLFDFMVMDLSFCYYFTTNDTSLYMEILYTSHFLIHLSSMFKPLLYALLFHSVSLSGHVAYGCR